MASSSLHVQRENSFHAHGAPPTASAVLPIRIQGYRLGKTLGIGSFGKVKRAWAPFARAS